MRSGSRSTQALVMNQYFGSKAHRASVRVPTRDGNTRGTPAIGGAHLKGHTTYEALVICSVPKIVNFALLPESSGPCE